MAVEKTDIGTVIMPPTDRVGRTCGENKPTCLCIIGINDPQALCGLFDFTDGPRLHQRGAGMTEIVVIKGVTGV